MVEEIKIENPTIAIIIFKAAQIVRKKEGRVLKTGERIPIKSEKRAIEIREDS